MGTKLLLSRRQLLPLVAAGFCGFSEHAQASAYPNKPITFIIPDGIGGTTSTLVRGYAAALQSYFIPSVAVEPLNDPGAGGQKAALDLASAPPDGYTIGMLGSVTDVKGSDVLHKLSWISTLSTDNFGLIVKQDSPLKNFADLQALAQTRPIKFSSSANTSISYFATAVFCKLNNIPSSIVTGYNGASASMLAVMRGDVDATCQSLSTLASMEGASLVRPILTFTKKSPFPGIDDATTIKQPDLADVIALKCVAGPPGLPHSIRTQLAKAFKDVSSKPDMAAWSQKMHIPVTYLGPEDTKNAIESQIAFITKWNKKLKAPETTKNG